MSTAHVISTAHVSGGLWAYYLRIVREKALEKQYQTLANESDEALSGAIRNFRIAAGKQEGNYTGTCFQDSDVGKWLEAVAYQLETAPDPMLEVKADELIELIAATQWQDGYLNTYFTITAPEKRLTNLRECCELYSFGHLAEGAAAYYEATGKRVFLDVMCRYADFLCEWFGYKEQQCKGYDGHPEAEYALFRLYEVTGRKRYLKLSQFFIDMRGTEPYYFSEEYKKNGEIAFYTFNTVPPALDRAYDIAEVPVRERSLATGHAVKLCYLLEAMAAVAGSTGEQELLDAASRTMASLSQRRMYITGSTGSTRHKERFTFDYDLPNDRAYAETCAAAGLVFAARRMLLAKRDGSYGDLVERALYNGLLSGMSLDGERWFYVNPQELLPLACKEDPDFEKVLPVRQQWFWCACCPPNLIRTVSSIHRYIYSQLDNILYVDLFVSSSVRVEMTGGMVELEQSTDFPWDGTVDFTVHSQTPDLVLAVRIPGYVTNWRAAVNALGVTADVKDSYAYFRLGEGENKVHIAFELTPRCVRANPRVKADAGRVAVMYGPLVYCMEEADNGRDLHALSINPRGGFRMVHDVLPFPDAIALDANCAFRDDEQSYEGALYREWPQSRAVVDVRFVPYFMWGNRSLNEDGEEMMIWTRICEAE